MGGSTGSRQGLCLALQPCRRRAHSAAPRSLRESQALPGAGLGVQWPAGRPRMITVTVTVRQETSEADQ
eukprot:768392-Hanusia_phi.AAC.14